LASFPSTPSAACSFSPRSRSSLSWWCSSRTASTGPLSGFAWGLAACAGYDSFRLPAVYVFRLWGDFFGRIGGWAVGTSSDYFAGYLWRYLGDGAGIGVVVFLLAAALGAASWPRRHVIGFTVAFAICPVWAGLVLTDGLAPAGRALFPLNATTLILSLAGHLIYGAILGWGLWASQHRPGEDRCAEARIFPWSYPGRAGTRPGTVAPAGEPTLAEKRLPVN
jgi:hypothetical protein